MLPATDIRMSVNAASVFVAAHQWQRFSETCLGLEGLVLRLLHPLTRLDALQVERAGFVVVNAITWVPIVTGPGVPGKKELTRRFPKLIIKKDLELFSTIHGGIIVASWTSDLFVMRRDGQDYVSTTLLNGAESLEVYRVSGPYIVVGFPEAKAVPDGHAFLEGLKKEGFTVRQRSMS